MLIPVPPSLLRKLQAKAEELGLPLEQFIAGGLVDMVAEGGFLAPEEGDFE